VPKLLLALTLNLCVFLLPFGNVSLALAQNQQAQQTRKVPVAILELTTKGGADASEGNLLTDRIRSLVVKSRQYEVMERALVDKILKEQGFQTTQNCDGTESCSVRIGQLLAVKEIITGSLNKIGDFYTLTLRKIDVERGTILKEDYYDCRCSVPTLMTNALPGFIGAFLQERGEEGATSEQDVSAEPQAKPLREKLDANLTLNIRSRKPWLVVLQAGNYPPAMGILQYNFGDYFALYGGGGFSTLRYYDSSSYSGYYEYTRPDAILGTKIYFNPHDWAVYLDLFATPGTAWAGAFLGTEYRHESGFTGLLSGGFFQSLSGLGTNVGINAGLGYAF
jgi:hypothetical protein